MPLSACLIVRDEERFLDRCLASLRGHVDEICVLDTGSGDRTVEIARSHGAILGSRPWDDDFSAARNASLDLASGDWILQVDADEELIPPALGAWSVLRDPATFCALVELDLRGDAGRSERTWQPRLFRRDPRLRYRRPLHETVLDGLAEAGLPPPRPVPLLLVHHGYLGEVVSSRGKIERNVRILRAWRDRGMADAYDLFKLASALEASPDGGTAGEGVSTWKACLAAGKAAPSSLRSQWPWWPRAVSGAIAHLRAAGALGEALESVRLAEPLLRQQPDVRLTVAETLFASGRPAEALEVLGPGAQARLRGLCLESQGDLDGAWAQWSLPPARDALKARLLARLGRTEEAVALLTGLFAAPDGDPDTFSDTVDALLELGERATALSLLESPPRGGRLHQGRREHQKVLAGAPSPFPVPTDADSAADIVVQGVLSGTPPVDIDPGFARDFVRQRVADRLESMLRRGEDSDVRRFARGAQAWDGVLPGLSRLVEGAS